MASILRYPFKFVWYERHPARLFDLSWDPQERSDVSRHHPEMMKRFEDEIAPLLETSKILGSGKADDRISPEILEALRALGYIE